MDLHLLPTSVLLNIPTTSNFIGVLLPSKIQAISSHHLVTSRNTTSGSVPRAFKCKATSSKISTLHSDINVVRRSANYHPPIWHYDYIQSLRSEYLVFFVKFVVFFYLFLTDLALAG